MKKLTLSTLALLVVSCFLLANSFAQDYFFQGTLNEPAGVAEREPLTPAEAELRRALAFDPAGRVLASGGLDKTVRLWDPHTGQLLGSLEHPATVLAVTFSPDGEMLASASEDNAIRLWDPHGRQLLGTLEGHGKPVYAVAFSPDGRHLASGSGDGTVRLWNPQSGELLQTFRGHNRGVLGVAFSETGLLASAGVDWTIQVYEVSTGRFLRTLTGHTAQVTSVAFTGAAAGDIRLISGSRDGTVHSWNPDTGELLDSLWPYPDSAVNSVALLANADATVKIASARSDGTVRLGKLDIDSGLSADPVPLPVRLDTQYAVAVRGVAFSPSGMHLASVSRYGTVQVWMQHPYSVELSGTTIAGPARSYPFTVTVRDTSGEPVENVLVAANDSPEVPTNALGEAVHELTFPTLGHHDVDVTIRVPVSNLESQEFRKYYPYRVEVPTPESVEIAGPTIVGPARSYPFTVTVKDAKDRLLEGFRVRIGGSADITDYSGEADFSLNFPTVGWHDIDVSVETGPKSALEKNFPNRVRVPKPDSVELSGPTPSPVRAGGTSTASVTVKDADGNRLEGFEVTLSSAGNSSSEITDTDGEADYSLTFSSVGEYDVEVAVQGDWLQQTFPDRAKVWDKTTSQSGGNVYQHPDGHKTVLIKNLVLAANYGTGSELDDAEYRSDYTSSLLPPLDGKHFRIYEQEGNTCGAYSAMMLLHYYGIRIPPVNYGGKPHARKFLSEFEDAGEIYNTTFGIWQDEVILGLDVFGFPEVDFYSGPKPNNPRHESLRDKVLQSRPPMILIRKSEKDFHWVVIVGYDTKKNMFLTADPNGFFAWLYWDKLTVLPHIEDENKDPVRHPPIVDAWRLDDDFGKTYWWVPKTVVDAGVQWNLEYNRLGYDSRYQMIVPEEAPKYHHLESKTFIVDPRDADLLVAGRTKKFKYSVPGTVIAVVWGDESAGVEVSRSWDDDEVTIVADYDLIPPANSVTGLDLDGYLTVYYEPSSAPAPAATSPPSVSTFLLPNYPNPFNPETWIPYQLSEPAEVTLSIYSVDGKLVRTLALGHQAAGVYRSRSRAAHWDGRNELGERVASGVYFYTLTAGDFSATGKMLIRK